MKKMLFGLYGRFKEEDKIKFLLHTNEDSGMVMFVDIKHPEMFSVDPTELTGYFPTNEKLKEYNREEEFNILSPKDNDHIKYIPKGSIKTKEDAKAFLNFIEEYKKKKFSKKKK